MHTQRAGEDHRSRLPFLPLCTSPDPKIASAADDEEDELEVGGAGAAGAVAGGGGGGGQGQQPMLYFPGYGYIPLSSLGNIPGLGQLRAGQQAQQPPQQLEGEKEWATLAQFPVGNCCPLALTEGLTSVT